MTLLFNGLPVELDGRPSYNYSLVAYSRHTGQPLRFLARRQDGQFVIVCDVHDLSIMGVPGTRENEPTLDVEYARKVLDLYYEH